MESGIPSIRRSSWIESDFLSELLAGVPPLIAAGTAAILTYSEQAKPSWYRLMLVVGAVWLVVASVFRVARARKRDFEKRQSQSPDGLLACTYTIYGLLQQQIGFTAGSGRGTLRITIYRFEKKGNDDRELERVLPYVGGTGGKIGKRYSARYGLIGYVARTNDAYSFSWPEGVSREEFVGELIQKWNFHRDEAEEAANDRRAWLGVPLRGRNEADPIGVLYMDSNKHDFFSREVQNLVVSACVGLSGYLRERYG